MLRDILRGEDPEIDRAVFSVSLVDADILVLINIDYDANMVAANAFGDLLREAGVDYPYVFGFRPNTGLQTGLDVNQDGYSGDPVDAHGYGQFSGQGGMAIMSKRPILVDAARNFSTMLWKDIPGNLQQDRPELSKVQRLSTVGHWSVPVAIAPLRQIDLLVWHATTPIFDGTTGRNDRRNRDENLFWAHLLDQQLPATPPNNLFVIAGSANLDPNDGTGMTQSIQHLLDHPAIVDPKPQSNGAVHAAKAQAGANLTQLSPPQFDTADWKDDGDGPGNLRVQYVLPSAELEIADAGVFWPAPDEFGYEELSNRDPAKSWHGIVWVDLIIK